jgi:predicted enzyme related to lactoylglutathione lyase
MTVFCHTEGAIVDWKLELVAVPVTDVDRAKAFYEQVGFTLDHDHTVSDDIRFIQFTPPGSACSIALGRGLTDAPVGSARPQIVVADVRAARAELVGRGIEISDVEEFPWGAFAFFSDPDGNRWSLQELTQRRS